MKDFFRRMLPTAALLSMFGWLTFMGCTAEVDDTTGSNLLPDGTEMEIGMANIRGINTYMAKSDSVASSRLGRIMIGRIRNDVTGGLTASSVVQFVPSETNGSKTNPYGYEPVVDSVDFMMQIGAIYGDPSVEQKFYIYRFEPKVPLNYDSVYYHNYDVESAIDRTKPLFSFKMKDEVVGGLYKKLEVEPEGERFLRELISIDTTIYSKADTVFRKIFQGLYVAPSQDPEEAPENAAVYDINPLGYIYIGVSDETYLFVYAHNHKKAPEAGDELHECGGRMKAVQDTVYVTYSFEDSGDLAVYPNTTIVITENDYTGSLVDESLLVDPNNFNPATATITDPFIVQGLHSATGYLHFTDEFISGLDELRWFRDEAGNKLKKGALVINKATLQISVEDPDDYEMLDDAPRRLGMYYKYKGANPENIPDYMYLEESYYELTIAYGGYLNRGLGTYVMDISMYVQALANNPEETQRGIWLGPSVDTQYEPKSVVLLNGADNPRQKMEVGLVYTLVDTLEKN